MTMTPMTTSSDQRGVRSHPEHAFDLATVLADKAATGTTVSACIPARNEGATVGFVVAAIRGALIEGAIAAHGTALGDEIVVVDLRASVKRGVAETGPGVQGERVSGARKPATRETGKVL